jgi:hypothetical protein
LETLFLLASFYLLGSGADPNILSIEDGEVLLPLDSLMRDTSNCSHECTKRLIEILRKAGAHTAEEMKLLEDVKVVDNCDSRLKRPKVDDDNIDSTMGYIR